MSLPLDHIRLTLVELIDDINDPNIANIDSQAAATNICNIALSDLREDELGILHFLRRSLDKKVHADAKVTFLEFTAEYLTRSPATMSPFIVDIKKTCQTLFLNDGIAKVKRASLLPIKIILSSYTSLIDPEALDITGLFTKCFTAYGTQQTKMGGTVKAEVLEVLGMVARYFPKIAAERLESIVRWCMSTVETQLSAGGKQELSLVAGAILGLDNCLYSLSSESAASKVPAIMRFVKTLVNVPEDLSRYAAPVAALDLFAHHIHFFRPLLIDIYEWMYQRIAGYCEHTHDKMSKCGYNALDVFLQEIANVLTTSPTMEKEYQCFLFFTTNFKQIISTEVVTTLAQFKAMSVAIRGYGYFAAPCKHIAPDQLPKLLAHLLTKSAFLVSSRNTNEGIDGSTSHLAAFITAYTFVAEVYDEIPELLMTALNQMANVAIVNFAKLSYYNRIDCTIAIERLLVSLFNKSEGVLRGFFDKFSYKLLVFTSSDISRSLADLFKSGRQPGATESIPHSYTIYLFLWRNLFKPNSLSKDLKKKFTEIPDGDHERFLQIIYGSTMESFKRLVSLLNLSVSDAEAPTDNEAAGKDDLTSESRLFDPDTSMELVSMVPVSGDVTKMQANCAKDFAIFQNLTEFWQLFLPEVRPDLFGRWTYVIGNTLIELSARHPLVSGFYKMFATCLQVCQNISLFKSISTADRRVKNEDEPMGVQRAAALFQKYVREVLARLEQYKDDLLASCLHLVLSSPSALTDSSSIIAPIQLALKLGLGYFPLASIGLDAVERWIEIVDREQNSWFAQVLPCLNEYLLVHIPTGDGDGADGSTVKSRKDRSGRGQTAYTKMVKDVFTEGSSSQVQSMKNLQLRILRLLGRQAQYNKLILDRRLARSSDKTAVSDLLAWDPEPRVKFKIPFQEMKTELHLDEMLPRIVDLAEHSLNRQTKVASCELLHSLVILMIGSSAFRARSSQDTKNSPFHKIYLKVFPALLRLAVDVDLVPQSLYRPLVSQLIHWLTISSQYENPETIALLSCCMDAACDTLGPLRDYGAECLSEFVKWSIKQSGTSSSSVNVKSLLKRTYNLASHSNPTKRLGAALIVNRIYRIFREEATLVNQFTLELLYWMLFGLRLAEGDHAGLGTRQQTYQAITHLQRIIQVKSSLFLKDSQDRRRFPNHDDATLDVVVEWLLNETAQPEVEYTRVCRMLFDSFVKLLPYASSPGLWIGAKLSQDPKYISNIYKGAGYSSETFADPTVYQKWSAQLASNLSNYIWLLNHPGSSEQLLAQLKTGTIMTACGKFLEKCLLFSRALERDELATPLTATERRQITDQNFVTVRRVISFVSLVASRDLERGGSSLVEGLKTSGLLGTNFSAVFAACLFNPDSIGNEELLKSENETKQLKGELETGLKVIKKLPSNVLQHFGKVLRDTILANSLIPLVPSLNLKGRDPVKCKAALDGIELVQGCGMLSDMFEGSSHKSGQFVTSLYETFMEVQGTLDPMWISYCSALLRLSMVDSQCRRKLWYYLLGSENAEQAKLTYLKYADEINRGLATHFSDLTPLLAQSVKSSSLLLTIWNDFLDYMFSHIELSAEKDMFLNMLTMDYSVLENLINSLEGDQAPMAIAICKKVVGLSPRILRMSKSEAFVDFFFKVYQSFFERDPESRQYLSLPAMSEAFPILPVFLAYPGARTAEFEAVFNRAILNMMPTSSAEYELGSPKFKDYIAALDLLLKALVASSNTSLFKTLMGIAVRESNHPHMERMQQSIASYALKLPLSKFLETTGHCFDEFFKRTHADVHRRNIIKQILLPILKVVPPLSVSEFFVLNIVRIIGVIKQEPPRLTDVDLRRDFIERECCYDLVHVMYMRLLSEAVNTKESRIVDAFTKGKAVTGKELTVEIFKTANAAKFKQESTSMTPEASALREDYKRAAYNALAAAILCTQRKEDFFRQFLFRDNEAKKEYVWENIVDLTAVYHFEQVLSSPLVKTRLSDLRSRSLNPNKTPSTKFQYMSSQYLRDSSLSQSVGMVDDGNVLSDQEPNDGEKNGDEHSEVESPSMPGASKDAEGKTDNPSPENEHMLELDAINTNPCMKMILQVISELHGSITPPPKEMAREEGSMPSWMRDMYKKMVDQKTPLNIRLFLAKIVINMPEAFEMYAHSWLRPFMRLAMEGKTFGEAMNYFVQDLCVLIVVWGASVKLENSYDDRVLLLSFLSYLMKNCYHEQRRYLLNNIELIKGVFENWSNIAIVPTNVIYNNFSNRDEKKNITGIQLLGIVLTHDNPPFYKGPEIDLGTLREETYYEALVRNMGSSPKAVYTSAAEVCGLVLAYMKKHNCMNEEFADMVTRKLSEIIVPTSLPGPKPKDGKVQFLNCLHKVQLNYPEMTDVFGPRLLYEFQRVFGEDRKLLLEILAGRAKFIPDLFRSLQGLNFLGCLKLKDEGTQFAALSIIYGLWESLEPEQVMYFLDTLVFEFSSHSSMECRKLYYSILMVLFEKCASVPHVSKALRTQLLRGLGDPSESIRHTVVEFWYGKNRLPTNTFQRLDQIVKNMYDPQAEDTFLTYATYMLLDPTKKSSDYTEPIFADSLPNAKFSDSYSNIDTSWRNTSVMTPLFVHTQQSQPQVTRTQTTLGEDELRATQSTFEFSMTMDGGAPGIRTQLGGTSSSSSALLFKNPSTQDGIMAPSLFADAPSQKYRRLQYRGFKTDQATQSARFKRVHDARVQNLAQATLDKETARTRSVSMIRKYRAGDLPDIQIPYADILKPLQRLAELDVEICRLLFSKLVMGLMNQADLQIDTVSSSPILTLKEEEAISFKDGLIGGFRILLERSTIFYTPFIGSILRICHDYGEANISSDLISKVSIRSSNQHLGIILLEKQIQYSDPRERSNKRQKTGGSGFHDLKRKNWVDLATVYKSIDEKDVFKSIYESKVATTEFTSAAIAAEVVGDYDGAVKIYFDGITKHFANEIHVDEVEQSIWAHGRLECLEHLADWGYLEANMMSDLEQNPQEIWTDDYQDPYLHYFLTSYIKLFDGKREEEMLEPWSADSPNPLFAFIDEAMSHTAHRHVLVTQYQPELALAAIIRKDFKQASHYVRRSYERFLSKWSNLHPLSEKPRLHELANLQQIVEMEEFLSSMDEALRAAPADPLGSLLTRWERRYPGKTTDTMITWNNIVEDRRLMVQRLEEALPYSRKQEAMVSNHQIRNFLQMSAASRDQGNFYVANNCISAMRLLSAPKYDIYQSQLKLGFSKAETELDRTAKVDTLIEVMSSYEEYSRKTRDLDPVQTVGLKLLGSTTYGLLYDLIAESKKVKKEDEDQDGRNVYNRLKASEWAQQLLRSHGGGVDILQELQKRGFECLEVAASVEAGEHMTKKLRLTTANYCDKILRHHENQDEHGDTSMTDRDLAVYAQLLIRDTLLSMRDEEMGATELFPRLLQVIEIYPSTQKSFTQLVSSFPGCWTFVCWIPQMVAILDKPTGSCVMPILKMIAKQYPNALYYPLTISAENYTFERDSAGERRKAEFTKLKREIASPLKEDFIFELRRLTNPEHLLKDWLEQTLILFPNKAKNADQIMTLYQDLRRLMLDTSDSRVGVIAKGFASRIGSKMDSLCKTGQKLATMSNKDFNNNIIKLVRGEIQNVRDLPKKSDAELLKSYSPWLSGFQALDYPNESIDIPGQYTGSRPPIQIATIQRFDQRLLVMSSIRKPKRLSILASDEKEHLFLVKGGEDLRLDQRVQQLFSLMNDLMLKDPQCSQQNISVGTYKVIPMSGSLGILEWVDNTKPLRHCIEGELPSKDGWRRAQEQHSRFVASFKGEMNGYHELFKHGTRDKVVKHMENLHSLFREDLLRQSIVRLAASPEAFLMLRSEFAKSLAAVNICSYILGIGDRHLENFLVNLSTGCLIPIDFGHAFGSATEALPVPEVAPFRLTRQLEAFLNPLGSKGLLEHPMVCIMKALQSKRDAILNTMDIFVKEPLLDWRKHAINQAREQKKRGGDMASFEIDEESVAPPAWYLQQKMGIARKKLEGYNPAHLTAAELNLGHANKGFLSSLVKTTLGDKQFNERARQGKVCTSVQAQVECLIDMATDLDILGRAWIGWMPWV
ncbi:hypothetical protein BG015_009513 [Linnemannia schmuckeri]|uniref:DNA-dependent protein kinase catalytic subunit n=1 Tax=Linnemannia schmuckeri TaxID=64567 RepID=A0A9P5S8X8_9FUNG|nr:hypothetical protein BG015_009513 [Linnemannia schmuckeri]